MRWYLPEALELVARRCRLREASAGCMLVRGRAPGSRNDRRVLQAYAEHAYAAQLQLAQSKAGQDAWALADGCGMRYAAGRHHVERFGARRPQREWWCRTPSGSVPPRPHS